MTITVVFILRDEARNGDTLNNRNTTIFPNFAMTFNTNKDNPTKIVYFETKFKLSNLENFCDLIDIEMNASIKKFFGKSGFNKTSGAVVAFSSY